MEIVNVPYKVFWRFKEQPHLKVTKCKKIINTKTGVVLKYHTRGFFISNRYVKRNELNNLVERIPKSYFSF